MSNIVQIGFTGTRHGMNYLQKREVYSQLKSLQAENLGAVELSHGACLGADEQVHAIAQGLKIFCHVRPGPNANMSMILPTGCRGCKVYPREPYRDRNLKIADCKHLIVAPFETEEQQRGGTWQTCRFGVRFGAERLLVLPDGKLEVWS